MSGSCRSGFRNTYLGYGGITSSSRARLGGRGAGSRPTSRPSAHSGCTAWADIQPGNAASIPLAGPPDSCRALVRRYLKSVVAGAIVSAQRYVRGLASARALTSLHDVVNGSSEGHGASVRRVEDPPSYAAPAVHGRSARGRRALRRLRPLRLRARHDHRDRHPEAAAAPGVVGVYTAADLDLKPFGTAGPPVDTPEAMRRAGARRRPRALHRRAGRGRGRRDPRARGRRRRARRRRLRPARRPRRHDHGARRRRAAALRGRQPRRDRPTARTRWPTPRCATGARFVNQRLAAVPMEPGAALAAPDPETGGFILYTPSQAPHAYRARSAPRPASSRRSCGSSRPPPAAASARASRATPSRSSSSPSRASWTAPCATSRRARRR